MELNLKEKENSRNNMQIDEKEQLIHKYKREIYDPFNLTEGYTSYLWADLKHYLLSDECFDLHLLSGVSVQRLRKLAKQWVFNLNKKKKKNEIDGVDYSTILCVGANLKWVELLSEDSFNNEGLLMNNCVSNYFDKNGYDSTSIIYSLRDKDDIPKITLEFDKTNLKVKQIRGRSNNLINLKYSKFLMDFLNYLGDNYIISSNLELGQIIVADKLENLGLYIKDNRFDSIQKDSALVFDKFDYKKRLGVFKSLVCESLYIQSEDVNILQNVKVSAREVVIFEKTDAAMVEIPSCWDVNFVDRRKNPFGSINIGLRMTGFPDEIDFFVRGLPRRETLNLQQIKLIESISVDKLIMELIQKNELSSKRKLMNLDSRSLDKDSFDKIVLNNGTLPCEKMLNIGKNGFNGVKSKKAPRFGAF